MITPTLPQLPTIPEVLDKLAALGSADQIALHLQSLHLQAIPGRAESCAVAEYIRQETHLSEVSVTTTVVSTQVDVTLPPLPSQRGHFFDPWNIKEQVDYLTPLTVREFIQKFDEGAYPELLSTALLASALLED